MAGTISLPTVSAPHPDPKRAQKNFARLMAHVANLYCTGGSSSVSNYEAQDLAMSVAYVLGMAGALAEEVARALGVEGLIELWHEGLAKLDARVDTALGMWRGIIAIFEVEILETVLRGADYCRFRITKESNHPQVL
jgi:hypothetical protein